MKLGVFIQGIVVTGLLCLHQTASKERRDMKMFARWSAGWPKGDNGHTAMAVHGMTRTGVADVTSGSPHHLSKSVTLRAPASTDSKHQPPCTRRSQREILRMMFPKFDDSPEARQTLREIERDLAKSGATTILCRVRHRKLTKAENSAGGEKLYDYLRRGRMDSAVLLARHGCSHDDVSFNDTIFKDMHKFMVKHSCWSDRWEKFFEKLTRSSAMLSTENREGDFVRVLDSRPAVSDSHRLTRKCRILKRYQECKETVAATPTASTTQKPHRIGLLPPVSLRYSITDKDYDEFIFY